MPATKKKTVNVLLTKHVEESVKLLEKVAALVVGESKSLTAQERQRSLKLRKGGERVIPTLATLATRFGVVLESHPTDAMTEKLQLAHTLLPLLKRTEELHKQLADITFRAQAESWETATVLYSTLRRIARNNGDVATTLAEVEGFFGYRHKSVAAQKRLKKAARPTARANAATPTNGEATAPTGATPATTLSPSAVAHGNA